MDKFYEVANIVLAIPEGSYCCIDFHKRIIERFSTLEDAQKHIRDIKSKNDNSFPFVIIDYSSGQGRLAYVEYDNYSLEKKIFD